jgi:hypothetical protein
MNIKDLIEKGYFPKELPPSFNTKLLADDITDILADWNKTFVENTDISLITFPLAKKASESNAAYKARKKELANEFISKYTSSKCITYSISKGKFSRRFLQIPNPKHFSILSEKIVASWTDINDVYSLSKYSKSRPVLNSSATGRSILTWSKSLSDFRSDLLKASLGKLVEVRVDISKFYPTIYTHAISWGLLGKEKAKKYFQQKSKLEVLIAAGDTDAKLYKTSEQIDMAVRNCQERQSVGVPIGPDTSHILSELIGSRIDSMLFDKFPSFKLKACRYYDDYYLYVSTKDEADKILKGLQVILSDFQLEINEGKIEINEFPFSFEDEFTLSLFLFKFKETNFNNSLKHYFSLIWGFAKESPKKADWIFKYALRIFEFRNKEIPKTSWKLFEDLLFKTFLIEPSILDIVTRILLTYKSYLDAETNSKLKELVTFIINEHSLINHNFELSWALWLAKTFGILIEEATANRVIDSKDNISILILLDMINNTTLVTGSPNISSIETELKDDILFSENWLLAYEGVKKGWLTPSNPTLLDDNMFFKILKDRNVEFYDLSKQLIPYQIKEKKEIVELPVDVYNSNVLENETEELLENTLFLLDDTSNFDFY